MVAEDFPNDFLLKELRQRKSERHVCRVSRDSSVSAQSVSSRNGQYLMGLLELFLTHIYWPWGGANDKRPSFHSMAPVLFISTMLSPESVFIDVLYARHSAHSKHKQVRSESQFNSGSGAVTHLPLPYSLFPTMPADPLSPAAAAASSGETPKRERSPPQSQSPQSPTVKHPRNNVDLSDIIEKLDKAVSDGDNTAFIQKIVQSIKKLCEVTKDQSNFINKYAELHEMHHKSFFNASQAVKRLREDSAS